MTAGATVERRSAAPPRLQSIEPEARQLSDYEGVASPDQIREARSLAAALRGLRVLHVSSTGYGGGVAEILHGLVPLMRDVGIHCGWQVIDADGAFLDATKSIHHELQGQGGELSDAQWDVWERTNEQAAQDLEPGCDVVVVHDPQPLPLRAYAEHAAADWVWRCHLDLSTPDPRTVARLRSHVQGYSASVYHLDGYAMDGAGAAVHSVRPAIDPFAAKNLKLEPGVARRVCRQLGIADDRPLVCQVSRYDRWKDPLGVIDVFEAVQRRRPDAQLALVGVMADDDPEGCDLYRAAVERSRGLEACHVLSDFDGVGAPEVNAIQSRADVVVQKSLREGFGLTVSEALWKGRPVVASAVGGIPAQVTDGVSGFLVANPQECLRRTLELLDDRELGRRLGAQGMARVRSGFLMPRLLGDWLRILGGLARGQRSSTSSTFPTEGYW